MMMPFNRTWKRIPEHTCAPRASPRRVADGAGGEIMLIRIHIVCSRCRKVVIDAAKECNGTTAGYYEVARGQWRKFANVGEQYLCDACMFADPRYIAIYGGQR